MPLSKLQFKPGINKEITKYSNEAGWNDCDKVRFRQGYPEKIGGWVRIGVNTFTGVCRSLHQWVDLNFVKYTGVGTNVKFMVEEGADYYDITPIRATVSLTDKIFATNTSTTVRIQDTNGGFTKGSYVTISSADAVGGVTTGNLNKEHVITDVGAQFTHACTYNNDPTITHAENANIVVGLPVSGTGIPAGAFIAKLNTSTSFELSASTTGGSVTDGNLTFAGDKVFAIEVAAAATSTPATGGGGGFSVEYQINAGPDFAIPTQGWSSLDWNEGAYNGSNGGAESLRVWNQANYGEDLIIGPRGGELYYWQPSAGTGTRAVTVKNVNNGAAISLGTNPFATVNTSATVTVTDATGLRVYEVGQHVTFASAGTVNNIDLDNRFEIQTVDSGSNTFTITGGTTANSTGTGGGGSVTAQYEVSANVPTVQDGLLVSDASRFVFCFGCDPFNTTVKNPLLIRWSDQEDMFDWRPRSTNQAGDLQLSQGTEIVTAIQSRQEILVFTDAALYSLQYVGAPVVWGSQLVGSNISVASSKAAAYANGVAYWMGKEKFYKYDGTVQALRCDVRKFVFDDMDKGQYEQVFAGTLEEYHEIWWFYVSTSNTSQVSPDKYVVYNYVDDIWYIGTLGRSAWLDSKINDFPIAATDTFNLVEHEHGSDDGQAVNIAAITSHITSGQFGIESGNSFSFVDRLIPDLSFVGSEVDSPSATISLLASSEPGSGDNSPLSEGGNNSQEVIVAEEIDQYTDKLDLRVRGRQIAIKVESSSEGTKWQLGTPRINMRPDGRRGS